MHLTGLESSVATPIVPDGSTVRPICSGIEPMAAVMIFFSDVHHLIEIDGLGPIRSEVGERTTMPKSISMYNDVVR